MIMSSLSRPKLAMIMKLGAWARAGWAGAGPGGVGVKG